ncbi:hypothetical protein PCANC_24579 [Puccinia coronata f. sp. avenae]|uniref:Retrotransposon Copia-like N-terminal domain-containing protein n=1 Tax=Puccinia coronata f. sp. avenae TaxID=200324 RepID=A0A2N5U2V3_9BASI|nr:hypothetical protein PCANC_24579 [Puccinia coronata f. sp. avenae]
MSNNTKEAPPTHTNINLGSQILASTAKISTARLPILKAPGSDSNYLNWRKVVLRVLKSAKANHVLTPVPADRRPATWDEDNNLVCAVLVQIVDEANLRHLANEDNTAKIWDNLSRAHQDSSTGGRVYWIRKLVNARMEDDDIHSHIESLAHSFERLNALVTPTKPLTPDDVHTAALLSSITPDWLHCVSALMNQEGVKAETIISALKNEAVRRESHGDIISVSSTKTNSSKPTQPTIPSKGPRQDAGKKPRQCPLCNSDSHDLNSCNNTRKLIADHKAAQKARWEASQQDKGPPPTKPAARAGRTSAATLGQSTSLPLVSVPTPAPSADSNPCLSPRPSTPDLPPLNIPLQPCFDRRLTASIHAPGNVPRSPERIPSDSDSKSVTPPPSPHSISPVGRESPDISIIDLPPLPPSPPSNPPVFLLLPLLHPASQNHQLPAHHL